MTPNSLQAAMIGTFAYVMVLALVRRRWVAAAAIVTLMTLVILVEDEGSIRSFSVIVLAVFLAAPAIYVFLRFGLLAIAAALMTNQAFFIVPLTADLTKPHAVVSTVTILTLMAVAAYAFYISKAGDGLLKRLVPA